MVRAVPSSRPYPVKRCHCLRAGGPTCAPSARLRPFRASRVGWPALFRPRDTAMSGLPASFAGLMLIVTPRFIHHTWRHAEILLLGAILALGRRALASLLRIMDDAHGRHSVTSTASSNAPLGHPRSGIRIPSGHLISASAPLGPVVPGLDDTFEPRCVSASRPAASTVIQRAPPIASIKTSGLADSV